MPKPQLVPNAAEDRAAVVDELGRLSEKLRECDAVHKRYDVLRKQVAGWYDAAAADVAATVEGRQYSVEVSARSEERKIKSMAKLAKALGAKVWWSICKVTMGDLDEHMTKAMQEAHVVVGQTGSRTVKVTRKDLGDGPGPGRAA